MITYIFCLFLSLFLVDSREWDFTAFYSMNFVYDISLGAALAATKLGVI